MSSSNLGRQTDPTSPNQKQDLSASATGLPGEAMRDAVHEPASPVSVPTGKVLMINRLPQKLVVNVRSVDGNTHNVEIPASAQIEFQGHEDKDLGPDVPVKIRRGHLQVVPVMTESEPPSPVAPVPAPKPTPRQPVEKPASEPLKSFTELEP